MKQDKHYNNYCICTSSLFVYYFGPSLLTHVGPRNPQLVPTPLHCIQCCQIPFHVCLWDWVTRLGYHTAKKSWCPKKAIRIAMASNAISPKRSIYDIYGSVSSI